MSIHPHPKGWGLLDKIDKGGNVNYFPPFYYILMVQSPPKYLTSE